MCGIAGYVDIEGAPPDESLGSRMVDLLAHRGPDGTTTEVLATGAPGPTVVVAHRRLAIIDLSDAAAQPLANEDGSVLVVFNGEIYNFRELRRELRNRGHIFRSRSDTEVLVHAYEAFGDDFVSRIDGMFAFALWDGSRRRLILARDRVGKKPLYYSWDGRRLSFASEIKSLRACTWVDQTADWNRIAEFLTLGYVAWPHTHYRGILQIPPACTMILEKGKLSGPKPYWDLNFARAEDETPTSWSSAAGEVRDLLRCGVQRRLVSDVPLGVLLSGGVDSSSIVALMCELEVPVRTFTVGIAEDSSYDERSFARKVAQHFGTEHTETVVHGNVADLFERLLWFFDQPFADSSAVPTYLISKAAREHVTVALTGDGGDEAFGGYERFMAALLAQKLPQTAQRFLGTAYKLIPRSEGYYSTRRRLERFVADSLSSPEERYATWLAIFPEPMLGDLVSPELLSGASDPYQSYIEAYREAGDVPLLHRLLYANLRNYLHDDLLVKSDRMAMANSLEIRAPFLDIELLERLASLPPAMKATTFGLKRLLRHALSRDLPRSILKRRKHGFGVPVGKWFRGDLKEPFLDLVLSKDARSLVALRSDGVQRLFREHQDGVADHGARLWTLLSLEMWLRMLERRSKEVPT
jgi:asparagine synthase (glutamine-hydrolysing)